MFLYEKKGKKTSKFYLGADTDAISEYKLKMIEEDYEKSHGKIFVDVSGEHALINDIIVASTYEAGSGVVLPNPSENLEIIGCPTNDNAMTDYLDGISYGRPIALKSNFLILSQASAIEKNKISQMINLSPALYLLEVANGNYRDIACNNPYFNLLLGHRTDPAYIKSLFEIFSLQEMELGDDKETPTDTDKLILSRARQFSKR